MAGDSLSTAIVISSDSEDEEEEIESDGALVFTPTKRIAIQSDNSGDEQAATGLSSLPMSVKEECEGYMSSSSRKRSLSSVEDEINDSDSELKCKKWLRFEPDHFQGDKVDYKATEWPAFNNSFKRIVDGQRDEAIRALSGRGQYRLTQEYHHLQVTPQQWARMTTQQRQEAVKCFDATPLHSTRPTPLFQPSASDTSDHFDSSVSLEGSTDSAGSSGQVVSNTLSSSESQSTRIFTGTHSPAYSVAQTLAQPSVVSTSEPTLNSCISTQGPTTISLTSTAVSGFLCSSPLVVQNPTINMYQPATPTSSSTNPFFLKFIQGNIRVCQGCRGSLRRLDGSIPQAPFDLAIARFERRPYRDKSGELRTLHKQSCHAQTVQ